MFLDIASSRSGFTSRRLLLARWIGLSVLLVAELLGLTLRFDTGLLANDKRWWAELLGQTHLIPQIALAIASATLVFSGARLRDELEQLADQLDQPRSWLPFFLGHLVVFASFAQLTGMVIEGDIGSSPYPGAWFLAWVAMAVLVVASWVACALPVRICLLLVRRASGPLLAGIAVGVAAWGAGQLTDSLWRPLGRTTLAVVQALLGVLCRDVVCDPVECVLGTSSFTVHIAPECSGYEGIGLTWVFLGGYLWYCRQTLRFPQALLLLPLGTAVIWLANAVRIAALIVIGTWGSREVALGGFHSQAGWLAFNAVALGLVALTRSSRFFGVAPARSATTLAAHPTAAYLVPLLAIVVTTIVTSALCTGFDQLYPLRVLAAGGALWFFRRHYTARCWTWSWQAVAIGIVVFALWMALEPLAATNAADSAFAANLASLPRGWAAAWLIFRVVGSVITVPLAEELAFRGYLTRRLIAADFQDVPLGRFTWFSFLVSSVLFGALHGRWLAGILAGMFYAGAVYRRKQLGDAVLAHAVTNALIAAYVLTTGTWSLWS